MNGAAFCPAHVTGFFSVERTDMPQTTGSVGAGFSIKKGVTATVESSRRDAVQDGMASYVLERFREATGDQTPVRILHRMEVPAGYGLGTSGALALSTLYALDKALGTGLPRQKMGMMAHAAEIHHNTGLGDVLAAYHGGFEIRVSPGGPGEGVLHNIDLGDPAVAIACLSPLSTSHFLESRMINGIGSRMVGEMKQRRDAGTFHRLSMKFARGVGIVTPEMAGAADALKRAGYPCGVAMLGGTVFSMVPAGEADGVMRILEGYGALLTGIDNAGARTV